MTLAEATRKDTVNGEVNRLNRGNHGGVLQPGACPRYDVRPNRFGPGVHTNSPPTTSKATQGCVPS